MRRQDTITIRPMGYTFKGLRYGLTEGCWIVSKRVAKEICDLYYTRLPRCGYDMKLNDGWGSFITNIANSQYRVTLGANVLYDVAPGSKWVKGKK